METTTRRSRRRADTDTPQTAPVYKVGAYVRLSAVDRKQKGDSIENQQAIIAAFVVEQSDMTLVQTYIDNGTTGTHFERPAFQQMLADMDEGKINCCISKDLSRLGRNAIDAGFYIEKHFPLRGIRYIAINENYDSVDPNSGGMMVSIMNLINERYALEIGQKIRATKQMNIRKGLFVGQVAPYGYLKSEADHHILVPDPEAAPIVRWLFEMAADGKSISELVQWLVDSGTPTPHQHYVAKGFKKAKATDHSLQWSKFMLYTILRNRVYCGDMVQNKLHTVSYRSTVLPASEHIVVTDTHEGIVSRELFDQVQTRWRNPKKPTARHGRNVFTKKLVCGHCGHTLYRSFNAKEKAHFSCSTRINYHKNACVPVHIDEVDLRAALLCLLQKQAAVFADEKRIDSAAHGKQIHNAAHSEDSSEIGDIRKQITQIKQERERVTSFAKSLYENLVSGDIDQEDYTFLKAHYEQQLSALEDRAKALRGQHSKALEKQALYHKAKSAYSAVLGTEVLTDEAIDVLVRRVSVFSDKRIEVEYRFSDALETESDNKSDMEVSVYA